MIIVQGLRKEFRRLVAVHDMTFSVADGEIFGLLGPNGGGKTTLFRILSTMLRLTEVGSVDRMRHSELLDMAEADNAGAMLIGGPCRQMIGPERFDGQICYDDLATGGAEGSFSINAFIGIKVSRGFTDLVVITFT